MHWDLTGLERIVIITVEMMLYLHQSIHDAELQDTA